MKELYLAALTQLTLKFLPGFLKNQVRAEAIFVEAGAIMREVARLTGKPLPESPFHEPFVDEVGVAIRLAKLPPAIANWLSSEAGSEPTPVTLRVQQNPKVPHVPDERIVEITLGERTVRQIITGYALFTGGEILPSLRTRGIGFFFKDNSTGKETALLPQKGSHLNLGRAMISALHSELSQPTT
ncbi:hypothetical protein A3B45_01040 [Candidatus Daviesbacteria bacterium RIFCSPLOWO2_01_FULL_39_12]|uniref:Uncharacterized protein n=1 Tax=Candidatus Daviesbacteria bacterium RIFCSPLOWO2_01_FULL_39_12 TaxID=1797785 RepID=A0A1F5KTK0_9BACT|nr:MAG: hypothetical protein A3D79_02970 [Candidatus Daviesbacteria bacterium RIFCSPHIGHO2_02_FULL_39_8]OGE44154.1 MAG: hypothetical protein A3B45_01040 [Candidatus Daviesbacteria bacterium RIFCSPLOWO2_01_FULL_39_12]